MRLKDWFKTKPGWIITAFVVIVLLGLAFEYGSGIAGVGQ